MFDDGSNVKYNLSTFETIGKTGKTVKDIKRQLRGYTIPEIIASFEDENYQNFLNFVDKNVNTSTVTYRTRYSRVEKIRNVGSLLECIKDYALYEQYFSAGLKSVSKKLSKQISEVPKGLVKLCKEYDIEMSDSVLGIYLEEPDMFNNVMQINTNTLTQKDLFAILMDKYEWNRRLKPFYNLIENYKYKPQSIIVYLDNLMTYEALENNREILKEIEDYVTMMYKISPKYDKYPKNFLTTHKIAVRNYARLKERFPELEFQRRINKGMEFEYEDYKFLYPNTTQEIKDEATQQNNCVASYIKRVIDGDCDILFMRKKEALDKSLVTIEVRNKKVVQARGKFNRDTTEEENKIIKAYNERLERVLKAC